MAIGAPSSDLQLRAAVGQRRYVTVLFSDLSDSSQYTERLEHEEYKGLQDLVRELARAIIPRHGGSIARQQGDGLLAVFGHPEAREDEGRRATEAALELHDAVTQLRPGGGARGTILQMHSGIHAGLVLLNEGHIEVGVIDVIGEAVNTASRLCSLAGRGEIFVSAETLGPQAHFFRISPPTRTSIRGRSAPLDVLRIEGQATVERRIDAAARRGVVPFVGREAALMELIDAAERARAGESLTVMVSGEPGIGKTRMIDEFVGGLDPSSYRVLKGYCEGYLGAVPLQPFMHWVRAALGWRAGASPEDNEAVVKSALSSLVSDRLADFAPIADAFVGARDWSSEAAPSKIRVSVLIDFIAVVGQERALVLVLDDWQWADDASRHALELLRARKLPMLVLLATRPTQDDDHAVVGAQMLPLEPLDADEAERAIAAWLPDVDPFVAQEVYRRSGGSPLFIEELCHAAAAGNDAWSAPRSAGVAWINALVASRLERLPESQAEILRVASVAGNTFAVWLLERLTGADNFAGLYEELAAQDFIVPAGQAGMLRFKHGLTRDAVYATVNPAQRRALHLRVAESLEAASGLQDAFDWLEALSYHYDAAGVSEKAAQYAEAAGDKALAAMSLDRARVQYITALRSLDALPELPLATKLRWCSIAQKLGQTCVFDPLDVAYSFVLFERSAQLARETGDRDAIARAEYWLGYVNYGKGRPGNAVRHCEAALEHALAADDQRLVAQVHATLAQALASAGRYGEALPLFTQAVASKRQQSNPGNSTAIGSAYTLARMAYTFGDLGRFDDAEAHFAESLHLLGDKVHSVRASVRELMCAVHLWQGRWEEARVAGLEGADIAMRCRSRYLVAMGRALSSCGAWALHGDAVSLQMLRESTYWIEARGGAVSTSLNYGWLVEAAVALGLADEARRHAARLMMRARAHDRHGEAQGCRALARLAASRGDRDRALHYLDAADRAAEFRDSSRERAVNRLARAEVTAILGGRAEARALAEGAGEAFESMRMSWHLDRTRELTRSLE